MSNLHPIVSACRHCRNYVPEGRRGGHCEKLGALVYGGWKSCSLAIPQFPSTWDNLEEIIRWPQETFGLQEAIAVEARRQPYASRTLIPEDSIAVNE